jgi:pSer/pThr/pTyr-binding forkhead associated (FHA) protein
MLEISLSYPTPEGSQTIAIEDERTSFGRGSEATHRFDDDGLSRLHATVYREGDRVWVVDENSTNGTFVNGEKTAPGGMPLRNGDTIRIGHRTNLTVRIAEKAERPAVMEPVAATPLQTVSASSAGGDGGINWIPIAVIAGAFFVISISVVFIVVSAVGIGNSEIVHKQDDPDADGNDSIDKKPSPKPSTDSTKTSGPSNENTDPVNTSVNSNAIKTDFPPPSGKKYVDMSDAEKRQYLEAKAMRVAQVIGNSSSDKIPDGAITKIKGFVDAYATRIKVKPHTGACKFGDSLQSTYERAAKDAPFVIKAFNEKGVDPRIGLYLAMIESEHCTCLQSGTGPLGMFQFTYATAKLHFSPSDGVVKGARPGNPDLRCQPEPSARAAASYMKALTGRYGTGPASVPLAIGSYNSGEGGLSTNLEKALDSGQGLPRDFWTLIEKGDILSKQFQSENFKYVPKFFAAAIIGENPQDFGLTLQPVSTYSK